MLTIDEYISREETIKRIKECYCTGCNSYNGVRCRACGTGDAIDVIEDAPVADVAPVVHGRWIMHDDEFGLTCECSACHIETMGDGNYCPNCGAKMDGGNQNV